MSDDVNGGHTVIFMFVILRTLLALSSFIAIKLFGDLLEEENSQTLAFGLCA
jgi:hypothetical protein